MNKCMVTSCDNNTGFGDCMYPDLKDCKTKDQSNIQNAYKQGVAEGYIKSCNETAQTFADMLILKLGDTIKCEGAIEPMIKLIREIQAELTVKEQ